MARYTFNPLGPTTDNIITENLSIDTNTSYIVMDFLEISASITLTNNGIIGVL